MTKIISILWGGRFPNASLGADMGINFLNKIEEYQRTGEWTVPEPNFDNPPLVAAAVRVRSKPEQLSLFDEPSGAHEAPKSQPAAEPVQAAAEPAQATIPKLKHGPKPGGYVDQLNKSTADQLEGPWGGGLKVTKGGGRGREETWMGPTGTSKGGFRTDIRAFDPKDGTMQRVQTTDSLPNGFPTQAEWVAALKILLRGGGGMTMVPKYPKGINPRYDVKKKK